MVLDVCLPEPIPLPRIQILRRILLCMLICMFATAMTDLTTRPEAIYEDDLIDAGPRVRAQTIRRLEMIWEACQGHISGDEGKPDPRFIEAGIRCLDREIKLYRLDQPQPIGSGAATPTQEAQRAAIKAQVAELEQRLPRETD